jgi:uncharacterized protein (TIRG00374 family)
LQSASVDNVAGIPEELAAPRKKSAKARLLFLIKFVISASLIYYLLSKANLAEIWLAVENASLGLIFASFLLHGIGYYASSYRWQLLLRDQGYRVPVSYLVRSYAIAMFFNNLLPSTIGGDGYRAYDTARLDIPKGKALAIVIVERFLGLFALMIFAITAFIMAGGMIAQTENLWIWSVLIFLAMLAVVWGLFFRKSEFDWIAKLPRFPGAGIIIKFLTKIGDAFAPFKGRTGVLAVTLLISLGFQLNVIFHYYLIAQALNIDVGFSYFLVFIPISILIQTLPVSINGIGVREGIYVSFLTEMMGKATVEQSLAFSWIAYGMILLLGILGGVIYATRK